MRSRKSSSLRDTRDPLTTRNQTWTRIWKLYCRTSPTSIMQTPWTGRLCRAPANARRLPICSRDHKRANHAKDKAIKKSRKDMASATKKAQVDNRRSRRIARGERRFKWPRLAPPPAAAPGWGSAGSAGGLPEPPPDAAAEDRPPRAREIAAPSPRGGWQVLSNE